MKTLDDYIKTKKPWEAEGVEWRRVKLKELVENVKSGFALSKQKRRKLDANNGIPQLRPYNIVNWNKINLNELTYIPKDMQGVEEYLIENEDVLFNNTNSIELVGRAAVYKELNGNYTYSNHITRIRVKKEIIIPNFLSWYLNFLWSKGFFYLKATKWIGQAGISNKKLLSIKILLPFRNGKPDLETQKKIVEYIEANFSRIDKILEKKKRELKQLDELWESVLEQAFKPREREEWREVRLGDKNHFHIETGATPKTSVKEYWKNGTIKWATPKDLGKNNGKYIYDTDRKITEAGLNSCSTTVISKGSIIISTRAPIGHIAILGDEMCFNQGCKGLVLKNKSILSEFVYYVLLTKIELMKTLGSGPTFEELSKDKLASIKIPLPFRNNQPDLEKQKEIANYLDSVYDKIKTLKEKIQKQITLLEEMKESILDEVFNHGEAG